MKRRFKILYISHFGKWVGGGQKGLLYILERVNKEHFEPLVIAPSGGLFLEKVSELNIPIKCVKMGSLNLLNLTRTVPRIINLIWMERVDLIHTDSPRGTVYGGIAAKITGRPLIYHVRVSNKDKLDNLLYSLSTKIIAVSKASAKRFRKSDKIEVIYNAIDLNEFNPNIDGVDIREEFNVNHILIGTIGQLIPKKGQKELLLVAPDIIETYPRVKFIIVGNGNTAYRKELEDLSRKLNIVDNVIFTGFREDIPKIISAIDIFVLFTSHEEGLCRSILEAMASGKPVITTNVGGNPETVINNVTGILLPSQDISLLKNALLELIKDEKKRKEMGSKGRERVEKFFNIDENIRRIEKVYLGVLKC